MGLPIKSTWRHWSLGAAIVLSAQALEGEDAGMTKSQLIAALTAGVQARLNVTVPRRVMSTPSAASKQALCSRDPHFVVSHQHRRTAPQSWGPGSCSPFSLTESSGPTKPQPSTAWIWPRSKLG